MNPIKRIFCRSFQWVLRSVLPVLPYRDPKVLDRISDVPGCLRDRQITRVLIVTDGFLHLSGMLEPLKKALNNGGIGYTIYDEVTPNPTVLNVELARERYLAEQCQGLIGFGGMGESGMGAYHGKTGFDTFSHYKSIVDKKTWMDLPMRYQPYSKLGDWLIHKFLG